MLSLGVPNISTIISTWCISERPGRRGLCASSSPSIHPPAHMSIAVVCDLAPSNNSGARYLVIKARNKLVDHYVHVHLYYSSI